MNVNNNANAALSAYANAAVRKASTEANGQVNRTAADTDVGAQTNKTDSGYWPASTPMVPVAESSASSLSVRHVVEGAYPNPPAAPSRQ